MPGKRKRREMAEAQFTQAIGDLDVELTVLRKRIEEALGDDDPETSQGTYLWLTEARRGLMSVIQRNFDAVLKEKDIDQRVRESRHRIAGDKEILRRLEEIVVPQNFVIIDEVRERMAENLRSLLAEGGPFQLRCDDDVAFLVEVLLPRPKRTGYVQSLLDGFRAARPTEG